MKKKRRSFSRTWQRLCIQADELFCQPFPHRLHDRRGLTSGVDARAVADIIGHSAAT